MICPDCQGSGKVLIGEGYSDAGLFPCDRCGGSGIAHCCEGDSAVNEPSLEDDGA